MEICKDIQGVRKKENISFATDIHNTLSEQNEHYGIKVKMYSLDHLSARAAESERQTIQQQTEVYNKKISNLFFHELGKKDTVN